MSRLTAQEVKNYRAAMKRQREKRRDVTRARTRQLKRKEVIESSAYPPIEWIWTDTERWVEAFSY